MASSQSGGISVDGMLKNMPKFFQMADDMHNLTTYINDMRIIMIVLIVVGAIGGAIYLIMRQKKTHSKKQKYTLARNAGKASVDDELETGAAGVDSVWTKELEARGKSGGFQLGQNLAVEGTNGNKPAHL